MKTIIELKLEFIYRGDETYFSLLAVYDINMLRTYKINGYVDSHG